MGLAYLIFLKGLILWSLTVCFFLWFSVTQSPIFRSTRCNKHATLSIFWTFASNVRLATWWCVADTVFNMPWIHLSVGPYGCNLFGSHAPNRKWSILESLLFQEMQQFLIPALGLLGHSCLRLSLAALQLLSVSSSAFSSPPWGCPAMQSLYANPNARCNHLFFFLWHAGPSRSQFLSETHLSCQHLSSCAGSPAVSWKYFCQLVKLS